MSEPTTLHDFLLAEAERWQAESNLRIREADMWQKQGDKQFAAAALGLAVEHGAHAALLRERAAAMADRVVVKPRNETDTMTTLPVEYADSVASLQARLTAEGRGM